MTRHRSCVFLSVFIVFVPALAAKPTWCTEPKPLRDLQGLGARLEKLASSADGSVGIGVVDLQSGERCFVNGDTLYPMASTYKIAMAIELLHRVDKGELSLDDHATIVPEDLVVSSAITEKFEGPRQQFTLRDILERMMIESDNTATDKVLEVAGGSRAVTRGLERLGIQGMRVDRPTANIIRDWLGWDNPAQGQKISLHTQIQNLTSEEREALQDKRAAAQRTFNEDPRDTSTPRAMAELLEALWKTNALNKESTDLLLDIMYRCTTGASRLKGNLPPGVRVAHKTGTIGETTNDVGILDLPNGIGHVVVAVFVKESKAPIPDREAVIAHVARTVWDAFVPEG